MTGFPVLEKAQAYLNANLAPPRPTLRAPASVGFVTLSRQSGTGGSAFAAALAKRLTRFTPDRPWQVYSANLIEEVLRSHHLSPRLAQFLPEDRIPEFEASVGEFVGLHPNLWELVAKTNDLIRDIARGEHAILLGRGATFATAELPHGLHVRLIAPAPERAARTARQLSVSLDTAASENSRRDAARERYVRSTFNANINDPLAYHLVLNTAALRFDEMVEIVVRLVHAGEAGTPPPATGQTYASSTVPAELGMS